MPSLIPIEEFQHEDGTLDFERYAAAVDERVEEARGTPPEHRSEADKVILAIADMAAKMDDEDEEDDISFR